MAITYTWNFDQLERAVSKDDLDDVIQTIYWRISGADGNSSDTAYGTVTVPEPDSDNFTAFADVTKAQVKAWTLIELKKQEITEASLKADIKSSIDLQKTLPVTKAGVPSNWS